MLFRGEKPLSLLRRERMRKQAIPAPALISYYGIFTFRLILVIDTTDGWIFLLLFSGLILSTMVFVSRSPTM